MVTTYGSLTADAPDGLDPAETTAIVLAAGRGERLRPFTDRVPKALIDVRGEPLLDYHLRLLYEAGVRRVVVVVGYMADAVRAHLGDGSRLGLEIEYVDQETPRGTGDAVAVALDRVTSDPFIVAYADVYWGRDSRIYHDLLTDRDPKIVAAAVEDGGGYGRLEVTRGAGRRELRAIREKDGLPTPALVNAGLYLLPRSIGDRIRKLPVSVRGEVELTDAVTDFAATTRPVRVLVSETWYDVGTPGRWSAANGGVP